jgi:hypothetical protein
MFFYVAKVGPVLWPVKVKGYINMMTMICGGIRA